MQNYRSGSEPRALAAAAQKANSNHQSAFRRRGDAATTQFHSLELSWRFHVRGYREQSNAISLAFFSRRRKTQPIASGARPFQTLFAIEAAMIY